VERAGADARATLRAYAGGACKLALPRRWHVGGLTPRNYRSPTAHAGLELRSSGQSELPTDDLPSRLLNAVARSKTFDSEWFAAIDVRLAKPYNFASADNPAGETEAWTPHLWTASPYGREFRHYAGSWHAMLGTAIRRRATSTGAPLGRPPGPEWIVALEWYRGYTPDGQLQDQRLRYRPRDYVVPSVTAHF